MQLYRSSRFVCPKLENTVTAFCSTMHSASNTRQIASFEIANKMLHYQSSPKVSDRMLKFLCMQYCLNTTESWSLVALRSCK